jgi:phage tail protein X
MVQRARKHFLATVAGVSAAVLSLAGPARAQTPPAAPSGTAVAAAPAASSRYVYGGGLRARWVSVPGWLLSLFLQESVPLSSYAVGGEFLIRKDDKDIVIGLAYQRMSPPDGNWLGRGKSADLDTDLLQFRNLALLGIDASYIWHLRFNDYVGFRYGAGLGIALVIGKLLRVSAAGCTPSNVGDTRACRPRYCPPEGCTEAMHAATEGPADDGPANPHRFAEPDVPPALPIVNFTAGFDFRIPSVKGLELRLEGGVYDAFFLGLATSYIF